ncbi:MAG: rhomboid family intramembrane serine protease [Rhodospirillaceae bacterium]
MAILPLGDDAPLKYIRFPAVNYAMIGACVAVFLYQITLPGRAGQIFVFAYGAIPSVVFGLNELPAEVAQLPAWGTLISSMFLHGGFMHIVGNMLFLWVLGDNVEDCLGHGRYVAFYLICGILAALAHALTDPASQTPMIGASGAISGVIGAYLVLHPRAPIRTLVWYFIVWLPAWVVLGFWIGFQFLSASMDTGGAGGGVAWYAHIGGFIAGAILILFMRRKDVPILDRNYVKVNHRILTTRPRQDRHGSRLRRGPWGGRRGR